MIKYFALGFLFLLTACKEPNVNSEKKEVQQKVLPSYVSKVIDAHGGLDAWNSMRSMSYTIDKKDGDEKQSINLKDRRERIERDQYNLGFDGKNYWTTADTSVNVNPVFYKNLIFYFYAMPFVAADDGIIYEEVPALEFEGVSYPGFKIGFESNVGVSPEDEYYIYYDAQTHQMKWLAYTVTYFSKEKSKKLGWRRYDDWTTVSGLKLPKTMARFESENNLPLKEKSRSIFKDILVSKTSFPDELFEKIEGARVVNE